MTNYQNFVQTYTDILRNRFEFDPDYAYAASQTTPEALAEKMTKGLLNGSANKDGGAIKATCKVMKIKHTYKAIQEYLKG